MSKILSVILQVFGYQLLIAMITTIRIEDTLVFNSPFAGRAVLFVSGMALLLVGSILFRKHASAEKTNEGE